MTSDRVQEVKFLIPGDAAPYEEGEEREEFGFTSRQGRLLRLSGWIDLDNKVSVGCVGGDESYGKGRRAGDMLLVVQARILGFG